MTSRFFCGLCVLASLLSAGAAFGAEAKTPEEIVPTLCRDGGGDWTRVVPVVVENKSSSDYAERGVLIPIRGTKESPVEGALPFEDELAQSIRIADSEGAELVFNIIRPDGTFVDKGVIGEGATLTLPATVASGSESRYWIFAGNERAYPNPDRLAESRKSATNLDFELGEDDAPLGWSLDASPDRGTLIWTSESPASGAKCVRCDVPKDAEPSWIAARQSDVAIVPGAKYRFSAWVRGKDVSGEVGWYVHIGNRETEMLSSPMLYLPKAPNFDWTRVSLEFVAPENATRIAYGTVLYGSGTAWYDDAKLVLVEPDGTEVDASRVAPSDGVRVERELALTVPKSFEPDFAAIAREFPSDARRAVLRIDASDAVGERMFRFDLASLETRWGRSLTSDDFVVVAPDGDKTRCEIFDDAAYFLASPIANERNYFVVFETTGASSSGRVAREVGGTGQAFPGTMSQSETGTEIKSTSGKSFALPPFLADFNLVADGGFENVDPETFKEAPNPDGLGWTRDEDEPDVKYSIIDPGVAELGARALRVEVGESAPLKWRGWRRKVKVEPNRTYCVGYVVRCDSGAGNYDLHIHIRKADGSLSGVGMTSLAKPVGGKTDWTLRCSLIKTGADTDYVDLHLTNITRGVSEYDNVFVAPVEEARTVELTGGKNGAFQVSAVAKVFTDTTFARDERTVDATNPARVALALGEEETLQFAFRGIEGAAINDGARPTLRGSDGKVALDAPDMFAVGNVLVDYPSNYFQDENPATKRKFPTGSAACDGWIGEWPDPLIPVDPFKGESVPDSKPLENDSQTLARFGKVGRVPLDGKATRAVWLRFKTTPETAPGVYEGALTLENGEKFPYEVEVLNFVAPPTKVAAIYDARIKEDYFGKGSRTEKLRKVAEKLLERKLSPDQPVASPKFSYDAKTGVATADWTEYDEQATRYFDELGGKAAYYPSEFYLFGWGVPPKAVEGENPYEGEYPYEGADRSKLRPEYKRAYQAKLKLFWEHIKEKGWFNKMVLYISDEPFYSEPEILAQMKALCDMIHEVDRSIPIYCSTWQFIPEWLGYLDVWGVGHYGSVGDDALKTIRNAGSRIWWTTDGQMCLDTPLCATERLLPYICVARGAEVYEFWGATWYTCDPFETASHLYISQSDKPGVRYWVRYPNGDGYIFYPGDLIGRPGEIIDSVRSEQAREGIEDAGWLVGLQNAIEKKTGPNSKERVEAQKVLDRALKYVPVQCGSGKYSTRYIADPKEFEEMRLDVGKTLEKLTARH